MCIQVEPLSKTRSKSREMNMAFRRDMVGAMELNGLFP